jgi:LytS/YehU family sensor histidine kinase
MALPNQTDDPTGVAAVIVAALSPVIILIGLLLGWSTELSTAVTTCIAGLVSAALAVWAILRSRKKAYAPSTVATLLANTGGPNA